jgi:hypothetical protein
VKILYFSWPNNVPLCIYTTFLTPSLIHGHLNLFYTLAILNSAAVNVDTDISLIHWFHFLWIHTQKWNSWLIWYDSCFSVDCKNFMLFSIITTCCQIPKRKINAWPVTWVSHDPSIRCLNFVCLCVCLSMHESICLCVYLSVCLYMYVCIYLYIDLSVCQSMHVSVCLSVHTCIYLCVYLSVHVSVCLCMYLSAYESPMHLSVLIWISELILSLALSQMYYTWFSLVCHFCYF